MGSLLRYNLSDVARGDGAMKIDETMETASHETRGGEEIVTSERSAGSVYLNDESRRGFH